MAAFVAGCPTNLARVSEGDTLLTRSLIQVIFLILVSARCVFKQSKQVEVGDIVKNYLDWMGPNSPERFVFFDKLVQAGGKFFASTCTMVDPLTVLVMTGTTSISATNEKGIIAQSSWNFLLFIFLQHRGFAISK